MGGKKDEDENRAKRLLVGDGQQICGPAIDNYYRGRSDAAVTGAIFSGAALLVKLNKNFHS